MCGLLLLQGLHRPLGPAGFRVAMAPRLRAQAPMVSSCLNCSAAYETFQTRNQTRLLCWQMDPLPTEPTGKPWSLLFLPAYQCTETEYTKHPDLIVSQSTPRSEHHGLRVLYLRKSGCSQVLIIVNFFCWDCLQTWRTYFPLFLNHFLKVSSSNQNY